MKVITFFATTLACFALLLVETPALAQQLQGNGNIQKETRQASGFTGINISGGFAVELTQGNNEGVVLEAEENLLSQISTEVKNGVLHIYNQGNLTSHKGMKAYITIKELRSVDISGGVKLVGHSTFKANTMKLDLSGGSKVALALDVKTLNADMSGAAKVELSGRADQVKLDLSGATKLSAEQLEAKQVKVEANGASKVNVFARESLEIKASGASSVAYKGSPGITAETSAAAKVSKL
ncbi:head GIN domain-containing protein [Pontibacter beigongshangensis]|uniref:head GIN domain-containing protein n=1 Tax=Pontibacter beigongshangensis TaxID=2574733 RepID=UPI00164EFBC0|nr:head GIN domain-containing protein [Pontibacter beigongshangensis]